MTWRRWVVCVGLVVLGMTADVVAAVQRIAGYREVPHGALRFVDEQFHVVPDRFQREALEAFGNPDPAFSRISLQAAAGVGKSG